MELPLDVGGIAKAIIRSNLEIEIALDGEADQVGDWILKLLCQFLSLIRSRRWRRSSSASLLLTETPKIERCKNAEHKRVGIKNASSTHLPQHLVYEATQ
jgi:hypothetical protein